MTLASSIMGHWACLGRQTKTETFLTIYTFSAIFREQKLALFRAHAMFAHVVIQDLEKHIALHFMF
jgi:hypothetical protein